MYIAVYYYISIRSTITHSTFISPPTSKHLYPIPCVGFDDDVMMMPPHRHHLHLASALPLSLSGRFACRLSRLFVYLMLLLYILPHHCLKRARNFVARAECSIFNYIYTVNPVCGGNSRDTGQFHPPF